MSTKIQFQAHLAPNGEPRDFHVGLNEMFEAGRIAVASWTTPSTNHCCLRSLALRYILGQCTKHLPDHLSWLFLGNSTWQPDSRIVRYKGFWRLLADTDIIITHSGDTFEEVIESVEGLRFFGAKLITELSAETVIKAIQHDIWAAYLVLLPSNAPIASLLKRGWTDGPAFDVNLVSAVSDLSGITLKPIGYFDDPEVGFEAAGDVLAVRALTGNSAKNYLSLDIRIED